MISLVSEKAGGKCKEIIITLWYDVTKREGGYKTRYRADIYYKPIDSKQYLRFNFGWRTKNSISFAYATRICRIVTNDGTFLQRMDKFTDCTNKAEIPKTCDQNGIEQEHRKRGNIRPFTNFEKQMLYEFLILLLKAKVDKNIRKNHARIYQYIVYSI